MIALSTATADQVKDKIEFLLATVDNLKDLLGKLSPEQLKDALDRVTEAEDSIDDFIFDWDDELSN